MSDPGTMILHYRLVERIGVGGMGEVWRAIDTTLDRDVAIKILPEAFASDPERLSRFTREARVLAALNHPSIASIHSVHSDGDIRFLVMEYIEGAPLGKRIPKGGLAWEEMRRIALPLADALAAAHARGITHRDLKPDNVLLTLEGRVKVLDFGLAKLAREERTGQLSQMETDGITSQGGIVGTIAYMSPEQAEGKPVDPRSDVFSLGIVLHEMATGRRPFRGDSPISTLSAILRDTPGPVSAINTALPSRLDAVVARCLEKDPAGRYASAGEVRDALAAIEDDSSVPEERSGRRPRPTRVALALAGVLAAALAGWLWVRRSPGEAGAGGGPSAGAGRVPAALAVLGFENLSDPADAERLGRVLMGLITTDLAESGGLEVVSTARVLSAIRKVGGPVDGAFDLSLAGEAAAEAGAGVMLVGQVTRHGEGIVLAAELVDTPSGRTMGSIRKEADSASELFDLAGSIAGEVRSRLGVATPAAAAEPFDLAGALTSSPEAYRNYAAGELAFHLLNLDEAERHFREAIRIDPEFAMAHYRLVLTLDWVGREKEGSEHARRSRPHADRLPGRWRGLYEALLPYSLREYEEVHAILSKVIDSGREIADAHYLMGEVLTHATRYWDPRAARRHFERALDLDPTFGVSLSHLLDAYRMGDDRQAMLAMLSRYGGPDSPDANARTVWLKLLWAERRFMDLRRAVETGPAVPLSIFQQYEYAFSLLRTGEPSRALQLYADYRDHLGMRKATLLVGRSYLHLWEGRFVQAIEDLSEASRLMESEKLRREPAAIHLSLARVHRIRGASGEALRSAREAVEADPLLGGGWYWLGKIALESDRDGEAEAARADLERVAAEIGSSEAAYWLELLRAEIALSRGRIEEARAALDRAEARPPEYRDRPTDGTLRARILSAGGDAPGAVEAYRRILDPPFLVSGQPWIPWNDWPIAEIEILPGLARLEEADGRADRAREHYVAYLARWGDADVQIPEVAEARARLSALER